MHSQGTANRSSASGIAILSRKIRFAAAAAASPISKRFEKKHFTLEISKKHGSRTQQKNSLPQYQKKNKKTERMKKSCRTRECVHDDGSISRDEDGSGGERRMSFRVAVTLLFSNSSKSGWMGRWVGPLLHDWHVPTRAYAFFFLLAGISSFGSSRCQMPVLVV